jgi:Cu(I)/Ag(I) efflux system membrane fusion protein
LTERELVVSQGNLYLDSAVQILAKRSMMQPDAGGPSPGHTHAGHAPSTTATEKPQRDKAVPSADRAARVRAELPEGARAALDQAYDGYFAMHSALSRDQHGPTKASAKQLLEAVAAIDQVTLPGASGAEWRSLQASLRTSADGVFAAKNMESARAAFEGVSNAMISVAKQFGTGRRTRLRVYHCPMAFDNRGARWMQDQEGLENPYFGSAMLTCGVLKESIEAKPAAGHGAAGDE